MKQSWLGWPTIQFVQVWGISGKTRRSVLKPRKSQANQDKLITLILIYSGTQIKSFQVGVFYISVSFGMWIIDFKCEAWKLAIYRLVLDSLREPCCIPVQIFSDPMNMNWTVAQLTSGHRID